MARFPLFSLMGSCVLAYGLISDYASLLAAQETGKRPSGFFTGCAVGLVSMVPSVVFMIWYIRLSAATQTNVGFFVGFAIIFVLFSQGVCGLLGTRCFSIASAVIGQRRYQARLQALQAESDASNEAT